jgi:2-dehydro-3-deoxyphosphogluconate aldolase/(4S)-4-hydroxy-2-oxoglutarate aldolase
VSIKHVISTLLHDGFILVFNHPALDVVETARALIDAGINNMEVTCRIRQPIEKIQRLKQELPDFVVGAASLVDFPEVLDIYNGGHPSDPLPSLHQAVEAGAEYLVSAANFSKASYERFARKVTLIPGCATATEILDQFSKGANFCKLFPANLVGGPEYLKAFDPATHKIISIIPTGGTNARNIPDYIAAGVLVLGGSFGMIEKPTMGKIVETSDYKLLSAEFAKLKRLIDEHRKTKWLDIDFARDDAEKISRATGRIFNI